MKTLIYIIVLFVFSTTSFCQYEQPIAIAETMASTFNFYGDKATGTCFMVTKDEKQYFVTAAHLFKPSHKSGDLVVVQMLIQNELKTLMANVYFHENRDVDVAIVKLSENVSQNVEIPEELRKALNQPQKAFQGNGISLDTPRVGFGSEVFFYGFPLGNLGTEVSGIKFPLLKKAILSGWVKNKGLDLLVLDGHNNLGFSGGPVVAYDTLRKKMCLVGLISGYVPEPIDVQHKGDTISVNENSGIIVCYDSRYIEEIFTKHKKDLR